MRCLLLGLLSLLVVTANAQERRYILGIGFYNVENFFHPENDSLKQDDDFTPEGSYHYTYEVYKQKMNNIAEVYLQLGTDVTPDGPAIIGVAEIESDKVLNDIIAHPKIKHRNYKYVWYPTPDVRGISTALIYNPKYFRVLESHPVKVPLEKLGQPRPTRNILYVKGVLVGKDTIHVMVNHWPSRSGGVAETNPYRELAASVAKGIADSLFAADPGSKVVIMGDLNDNPRDPSVTKVLNAKADTTGLKFNDIFNPWINIHKKGYGTEIFENEWNLLDQIMISGTFFTNPNNKWRYYRSKIFNKEFLMQENGPEKGHPHRSFTIDRTWDNGFSDHFPVIVYLVQ